MDVSRIRRAMDSQPLPRLGGRTSSGRALVCGNTRTGHVHESLSYPEGIIPGPKG